MATGNYELPQPDSRTLRWLQASVLALLIGMQWLVTRDLFDGAVPAFAQAIHNPDGLYFWLMNGNWLVGVWFFKLCFALADWTGIDYLVWVKLMSSSLMLGLYAEFVALNRRLFDLPEKEAALAGLLGIASAALYIVVNSCAVPLVLCAWLAFAGHRLFDHPRWWGRLAGLAVLAVSFQLNSNLVFVLALEFVFLCRDPAWRRRLGWSVLLFATAVAVYATMRLLAPPKQIFVEYNQILNPLRPDDLRRMSRAILMFLTWGIIPLSVLAVLVVATLAGRPRGEAGTRSLPPNTGWHLLMAAFLCAAAAFPYVMVGKGPPLFTYVGYGDGLTEQVLRAAHGGPLAPTWANTAGRHALLYSFALAMLVWQLARTLHFWLSPGRWRMSAAAMLALVLPLFLVWIVPAYKNKLDHQFAELSLVKGFRRLPAPPAGVVDLRYTPASDWLIWVNAGAMILREAWGRSHYYPMFHSLDAYRDDLQWGYHVLLRNVGGLTSPLIQHTTSIENFPGEECTARYEARLPRPSLGQSVLGGLVDSQVPAADVRLVDSRCQPGYVMPNPTPLKKLIP